MSPLMTHSFHGRLVLGLHVGLIIMALLVACNFPTAQAPFLST